MKTHYFGELESYCISPQFFEQGYPSLNGFGDFKIQDFPDQVFNDFRIIRVFRKVYNLRMNMLIIQHAI